ncbi:hypothetical protein H5392_09180 [Tessaracoccus sp. MC1865]|uniref:hypothetical protein n=1 Tax=Tessaracoccus sp. MC1865 TaxID=2760310 RepID=UPI0015FF5E5B|nr:hypothetical protein [Tessaracoccus sp. MC1865]MBB1484032.1 hypothetical protein [Tessaracoccus sp. MC1865]QTO37069.1 hypothetical protein J7D54_11550 [Tessaracoccus sp. MC1865]
MKRLVLLAVALATGMSATAPLSAQALTECRGSIRENIAGDVVVPRGAECAIAGRVDGNIHVMDSGSLLLDGGFVTGDVTSERAKRMEFRSVRIGGDVVDTENRMMFTLYDSTVEGGVSVTGSRGQFLIVGASLITGSVAVADSVAQETGVPGNVIGGNLVCERNAPAPEAAEMNIVSGKAIGQCASLATPPSVGDGPTDVYVIEGFHAINGRMWRTACQPYSNTQRCRTEIQATVVEYENGQFRQVNGWAFNNLTYRATDRAIWTSNPLGGYGVFQGAATWYGTDGRKWRTECDTPATGRGGCRTYVTASVVERRDGGYVWVSKELLNNMVRFK